MWEKSRHSRDLRPTPAPNTATKKPVGKRFGMQVELSKQEISEIETHIDQIDRALDILDPNNAIEAQEIERKAHVLRSYVSLLESPAQKPTLRLIGN
jgi:hypothetical protein